MTGDLCLSNDIIDFGVVVGKNKPTTMNLGYEGEFGSKYFSNQLMLTIRKDF
ncbi:MAG: hypothetical protein NTX49_08650 [Chlamydiae bacterium]|nr:hypothetical protein [Chlamydiota bacterium]